MVFYTGDIHGNKKEIVQFCGKFKPTPDDVIVILGDVGANFYGGKKDYYFKFALNQLGPIIFCIHGNHERRPYTIPNYKTKQWHGGTVWYEPAHPNLLFAKDGEIYDIEGIRHLVIGGAYSVDKHYRLMMGYAWWPDEQPSEETKRCVEQQIKEKKVDVILSHTCPLKYEPVETFLPNINQRTVDRSTEQWLDFVEENCDYKQWLCGHWHVDKRIDKMRFLFHDFVSSEDIKRYL